MYNFRSLLCTFGAILLIASLLAGCGTTDPKNPTPTTNGMITAMLAVTDSIISNATTSPVNTPFATQPPPPATGESDPAGSLHLLAAMVGNLSQPQAVLNATSSCRDYGTVTLSGSSATVTDGRDAFGHGLVSLDVPTQTATITGCHAHGMTVNGTLTLSMSDTVQIDATADPNIDLWTITRHDTASGGLSVVRDFNNGSYSTGSNGLNWTRNGGNGSAYAIRADYDRSAQDITGPVDVNQALFIRANGQTCNGTITAVMLFSSYHWNCSGQ